jgi:hypothetical protein
MTPSESRLLQFLNRLDNAKIHYTLAHYRPDAILVAVSVPGQRWEIEFMADGTVDVEIYKSNGEILGEQSLQTLFEKFTG